MRHLFLLLLFSTSFPLFAAEYEYTLRWLPAHTHTYVVEVAFTPSEAGSSTLMLPSWRPGRYFEQDFSAGISHFEVVDDKEKALLWRKTNKDSWVISYEGRPSRIVARYHFFANNMDSGSSYFDEEHLYFNPINLFMYLPGRLDGDVVLSIPELPSVWKMASALTRLADGKTFTAKSYHEFVDSPTILAKEIIQTSFVDQGATFHLHFHGAVIDTSASTIAAVADMVRAIAQQQSAVFGGYPFEAFHFLYRFLPYQLGHGVEHEFSTVISVGSSVTENQERFVGRLKSLTSHELWHAWNVKRLRPEAMWPYDYSGPQYTSLHWFTEGVTDYYTNLMMLRAGYIDENTFFATLANTINSLEGNYASQVVSPSMSSMDAWLSRSDYGNPDYNISYYTLGSRLGFLIDMELRSRTQNRVSFDDAFRYMWKTYYLEGKGFPEDGVQQALETLSGDSWEAFFQQYVHGTGPIDYAGILSGMGLELKSVDAVDPGLRGIGIMQSDKIAQGILLRSVHPGSDAFAAGLGSDQLILEIDGQSATQMNADEYLNKLRKGDSLTLKVLKNFRTVEEVVVVYRKSYTPRSMSIDRKKRISQQQKDWLSDWMAPAE